MARVSVKGVAKQAQREDTKLRKSLAAPAKEGTPSLATVTHDSFVNFAQKMGVGADNALSDSRYGFNPITRLRTQLEWIHRGSWLGGIAIDVIADDMTRAGIEYVTELDPDQTEELDSQATALNTWTAFGDVIRWGRLYGGAIAVALVDGQDMRTPLRLDTIGPGQYRGMMVLDRWQLEPSLDDLVTEYGPFLGLPRFYRVQANAPALRGMAIHYTRVLVRHVGVDLPYQQRIIENLWGISILERIYDRMIAFDSATTGAAQLVYKSYLRTLSVEGLRDVVAAGGIPMSGVIAYTEMMRRYQSIEGITLIDAKDKLEIQGHQAFSGLGDALIQFGQQLSGALQIPLVRMFGQSPAGLNSTGESDIRTYYDNIAQRQNRDLHRGVHLHYRLMAKSNSIAVPGNFTLGFKSLWQLTDADKSNIGKTNADTVDAAYQAGIIGRQTALKELRQGSRVSGVFTNITRQMIAEADEEVNPAPDAGGLPGMPGAPMPPGMEENPATGPLGSLLPDHSGDVDGQAGPDGQASPVGEGKSSGGAVPVPTLKRRPPSAGGGQRPGT